MTYVSIIAYSDVNRRVFYWKFVRLQTVEGDVAIVFAAIVLQSEI